MSTPAVTVVVVSYNTRYELLACLRSVSATALDAELIVVDNASSDGSAEAARPLASVIANEANRGFSVACNQGWRAGRAPRVLFLNSDCELQGDALAIWRKVLGDYFPLS